MRIPEHKMKRYQSIDWSDRSNGRFDGWGEVQDLCSGYFHSWILGGGAEVRHGAGEMKPKEVG